MLAASTRFRPGLLTVFLLVGCHAHDTPEDGPGPKLRSFKPLIGKWALKPAQKKPAFLSDMKRFPGSEADRAPTLKQMNEPGRKLELTVLMIAKVDGNDFSGMVQVFSGGKSVCVTPLALHVTPKGKHRLQVGRAMVSDEDGYALELKGDRMVLTPAKAGEEPLEFQRVPQNK